MFPTPPARAAVVYAGVIQFPPVNPRNTQYCDRASGPAVVPFTSYLQVNPAPLNPQENFDPPHGARLFSKAIRVPFLPTVGAQPAKLVNIYNSWTKEVLTLEASSIASPGQSTIDRFLRCHFTNQSTDMDPKVFDILLSAARKFNVDRIDIISGYRAPKYNLILRKKGHGVARNSQHTEGRAIDFRLPGIPVRRVHAWAQRLALGGVGFYPSSGFVHVDSGRRRYWRGN